MLPEVRAELDRIEAFLLRFDEAARDLAAILSALRGPDSDDYEVKRKYTLPIRCKAFPKLEEAYLQYKGTVGWNMELKEDCKLVYPTFVNSDLQVHFRTHILNAIEALNSVP